MSSMSPIADWLIARRQNIIQTVFKLMRTFYADRICLAHPTYSAQSPRLTHRGIYPNSSFYHSNPAPNFHFAHPFPFPAHAFILSFRHPVILLPRKCSKDQEKLTLQVPSEDPNEVRPPKGFLCWRRLKERSDRTWCAPDDVKW